MGFCHLTAARSLSVKVAQSCLDSAMPWTVACQAPLSMKSPGKYTGVDCRALLQGIFLIQGSNLGLLHCRQILYHLSHQGRWSLILSIPVFT